MKEITHQLPKAAQKENELSTEDTEANSETINEGIDQEVETKEEAFIVVPTKVHSNSRNRMINNKKADRREEIERKKTTKEEYKRKEDQKRQNKKEEKSKDKQA